jgi:thioredoxin-dependent peroxiredoxin
MANVALKGNPIYTVGELPKVGSPDPDFRLIRGDLADFEGKVEDPQHRAQPRHQHGSGLGAT